MNETRGIDRLFETFPWKATAIERIGIVVDTPSALPIVGVQSEQYCILPDSQRARYSGRARHINNQANKPNIGVWLMPLPGMIEHFAACLIPQNVSLKQLMRYQPKIDDFPMSISQKPMSTHAWHSYS